MSKSQKKRDIPAGAVAVATNRVARRDYDILDHLECGIMLKGSEVKSLRESRVQLQEAYAIFYQGELWLQGLHITAYSHSAAAFAHDTDRRRKLLAHRSEIERWSSRVNREKLALIPLAVYFREGRAKVDLALARGKKQHDRRQEIAKRDAERDAQRASARTARRY